MKTYEELAALVKEMRDTQNRYFKTKDQDILMKSKKLEKQVDDYISNNPRYEQTQLF